MLEIEAARMVLNEVTVSGNKPRVVVGIPAFNEEKMISKIVFETKKFADVVVVCDDGSSDQTAAIAKSSGADVVMHEHNLGYGAAIKSLFRHACELDADILVTLDADGQHNPAEIPNVVKPIANGIADVVIGSRFIDAFGASEMPLYRRIGAKLITRLVNGSSKNGVSDAQSGFRAYNRQALESVNISEAGMGASVEILYKASKHKLKIYEVPSSCKYENGNVATSTEHPVIHGLGVILSIIKMQVEGNPFKMLGMPAILSFIVGALFCAWTLQVYIVENIVVTSFALAFIAFTLIGFYALYVAIKLHALSRLAEQFGKKS